MILSLVTDVLIFKSLGILLIVVGVILVILGKSGRAVGGRNHYWWALLDEAESFNELRELTK